VNGQSNLKLTRFNKLKLDRPDMSDLMSDISGIGRICPVRGRICPAKLDLA
jgi:hypothetical protein